VSDDEAEAVRITGCIPYRSKQMEPYGPWVFAYCQAHGYTPWEACRWVPVAAGMRRGGGVSDGLWDEA
jgi:hypothetical protein